MAGWEDDSDLGWESTYQQAMWQQLQQQHPELQLRRNETISTSGLQRSNVMQRAFNTRTAIDDELSRTEILPHQQRYYLRASNNHGDNNSLVSDVDSPATKHHSFSAEFNRSTTPVDYVKLNRYQLKGRNNRKFIYPQKTYSEMFNKKKPSSVGCINSSRRNVFGSSSQFLPHKVDDKLRHSLPSPKSQQSPTLPQYPSFVSGPAVMPYFEQKQSCPSVVPQRYTVLPPITAYAAKPVYRQPADNVQRVSVDITVRLPDTDVSMTSQSGAPAGRMMTSSSWQPPMKRPVPTPRSDVDHRLVTRSRWH